MAWRFALLKLILLASAFRRGWAHALGLVAALLLGVPAGLAVAGLLAGTAGADLGDATLIVVYALFGVGWAIGPLVLFGLDETLDPARLRLLPLTRRQLVAGLLGASAVGVGPLVSLIAFAGAVPGRTAGLPAATLVVVAVLVQLTLCLLLARAVVTALAARLRSRRGRDALATGVAVVALASAVVAQLPNLLGLSEPDPGRLITRFTRAADLLGWLPVAWPARAITAASEGALLAALAWLAATALLLVALGRWWARSLERALTTAESTAADATDDGDLFPGQLARLPANRLTGAIAKELRYALRVPQVRVQWMAFAFFSLVLIAGVALVPALRQPPVVLAPALLAALQGLVGLNAFGADGGAVWLLLATGGIGRADLAGKNVAAAILILPAVGLAATGLAALSGGWGYIPLALMTAVGLLGITMAVTNFASVLAPSPLSDVATNPFAGTSGTGCVTAFAQLIAIVVTGLVAAPVLIAFALALTRAPGWVAPAAVAALVYGLGCWWLGLRLAGQLATNRGPEILAALTR